MDTLVDLFESEVTKLMALLDVKPESMGKYIDALGREKVLAAIQIPLQERNEPIF